MAHRLYIYQSWLLPTEGAGIEIYDPRIGWSITELLPTVGAGIEMTSWLYVSTGSRLHPARGED